MNVLYYLIGTNNDERLGSFVRQRARERKLEITCYAIPLDKKAETIKKKGIPDIPCLIIGEKRYVGEAQIYDSKELARHPIPEKSRSYRNSKFIKTPK